MIGAVLNDRYRLDAELGHGGRGVVYRARDLVLDRDVAAKVVSAALLGTQGRARLLREARSAAQLNHPNIVSIYDAGEATVPGIEDPVPYIIMELVAGPSLHECPPETLEETLRLTGQICTALEHAHAHGIIHRDLKPENVLLAPGGARGSAGGNATAKLNDFGLARSMASRLTTEGTVEGTVFYLAPELALGKQYDGRADLYALGVMLYELATGELPFTADDPLSVISQHLYAPPVPPRARNAAIAPALDALILRLLNKRPEDRPRSAAEVGEVLQRLAAGEALPAQFAAESQELSLLDRIARGRLVAREEELAYMRAVWQRAAAGEGQVLLVSGEPGVGKSRLVRELVTQVQVAGNRALVGECYSEGGAPYAPFGQMVRRALESDAGEGPALPDFVLADLVALAPALRLRFPNVPPNPALDPESQQQRLIESVVALCTALSKQGPLLLVLEDGHWADSGSLALLRNLARRTRKQPVLIVVTYREVELDETRPFRDVLVDLNRERLATHLELSRLDREGTRQLLAVLLAEAIAPEFLDGIYRATEGNPFFVEEMCKALVEDGSLTFVDGRWQRPSMERLDLLPRSVRLAIQSRVGELPEQVQRTLEMAAILGREFSADVLTEAMAKAGADEAAVIEALETGLRAQLVEEVGGARELFFAFIHALVAATLAEEVPILRRRRLHRYAAEAVERLHPEDNEALARHFEEAGVADKAVLYLRRAGELAAARYANQEAVAHFSRALALLPPSDGEGRWLALLGRDEALGILGRTEQRMADDAALVALAGQMEDAGRLAEALSRQGYFLGVTGRYAEELIAYEQGLAAARRAGASRMEAHLLGMKVACEVRLGDLEAARVTAEAAVASARALGDDDTLARNLHNASIYFTESGDLARAAQLLEEQLEISRRTGDRGGEAMGLSSLGYTYVLLGLYREGIDALGRSLELAQAIGRRSNAAYGALNLALAHLRAGAPEQALALLDQWQPELLAMNDPFGHTCGETYRAMAWEQLGDLGRALAGFTQSAAALLELGTPSYAYDALAGAARCLLKQGLVDQAASQIGAVCDHLTQHAGSGMEMPILDCETCADVLEATGDLAAAHSVLCVGYGQLMVRAEKISVPEWRRSFLEAVPEHARLVARWQRLKALCEPFNGVMKECTKGS
jgi:tetratricopeptide (TPR) repeat protein